MCRHGTRHPSLRTLLPPLPAEDRMNVTNDGNQIKFMEHGFRYATRPTPTRIDRTERFSKCFVFRCRRNSHRPRYSGCSLPASSWCTSNIPPVYGSASATVFGGLFPRKRGDGLRKWPQAQLGSRRDYVYEQAPVTKSMMFCDDS